LAERTGVEPAHVKLTVSYVNLFPNATR
jgi:hypothetical protein